MSSPLPLVIAAAAVSSGLLFPVGVLGLVIGVGVLGLAALRVSGAPLRRLLAEVSAQRARDTRRDERVLKLVTTRTGYSALLELTALVSQIEARDRERARRFDLEGLLDRYAALVLAHDRALDAVQMADREQLTRAIAACRAEPDVDPRRVELCERRLRCLGDCEAQARRFADELAIVADTIRLIAQQVACPGDLPADEVVDKHLAELDDNAAANRQVAAALNDRVRGTPTV